MAEFSARLNRRHKAALCATLICVGLILLLSRVGVRPVLGITLLGTAFSWALGSNNKVVHWLFLAFGVLLLLAAMLDGYLWPRTKAELVQGQTSIIEADRTGVEYDRQEMKDDEENAKGTKDTKETSEAYKNLGEHSKQLFSDSDSLRKDEVELRRLQAEGVFRRVVEIDWGTAVGGLLLLGAGLGLVVGVKPPRNPCNQAL